MLRRRSWLAAQALPVPRHVHNEFVIAVTEQGAGRCVTVYQSERRAWRWPVCFYDQAAPGMEATAGPATQRYSSV